MFLPFSCSWPHRWVSSDLNINLASAFTAHTLKGGISDTVLDRILPGKPRTILRLPTSHMNSCHEDNELFFPSSHPSPHFYHPFALSFSSSSRPTSFRLRGWQAEELRTNSICPSVHVCPGTGVMLREAEAVHCVDFSLAELWLWLQTVTHWRAFAKPASWESCVPPLSPSAIVSSLLSSLSLCFPPLFLNLSSSLRLCGGFNLKAGLSDGCGLMD